MSNSCFYKPWKHQKTCDFLMFSRGTEMEHRREMGWTTTYSTFLQRYLVLHYFGVALLWCYITLFFSSSCLDLEKVSFFTVSELFTRETDWEIGLEPSCKKFFFIVDAVVFTVAVQVFLHKSTWEIFSLLPESFYDGGQLNIETSPLICRVNHWTGFLYDRDLLHKRAKVMLINIGRVSFS